MHGGDEICPRCGLPIGRGATGGPVWTPQMKGVEVCGCPDEERQAHERAVALEHDLVRLQHELDDLKHEG